MAQSWYTMKNSRIRRVDSRQASEKAQPTTTWLKANVMNKDGNDTADTSPTHSRCFKEGAKATKVGKIGQSEAHSIQFKKINYKYGAHRQLHSQGEARAVPWAT